jgi:hypothetical protein
MTGKKVLDIYQRMASDADGMSGIWRECIRYCYPQDRPSYTAFGGDMKTNGWKRTLPVCSYPVVFAQRLASSIHSNAFPANDYWFDFAIVSSDGKVSEAGREWCRKARDITHQKIRQGTNFYQESHALMNGLVCLGTAGFYTYYKGGSLHFRYIPVHKNFYVSTNPDGEVNMVAILHQWTAKEAIEEYGEKRVSDKIREAFKTSQGTGQTYSFVQLIYPKKLYGEKYSLSKGDKPYGDVTVEMDTQNIVKTAQHGGFPFAVPRFEVYSDDTYGRCPAMAAMPEIKAVNSLRKTLLDAGVRAIKPPLFLNGLLGNVNLEAGAVNRSANFDKNSVWTYPTPTDFPVGKELMADILEPLKSAFYIDVFQAIEQGKYMTATEVTARTRSKVDNLAPIITRIQKEFSSKVVLRSLELLIENGDIEPPPVSEGEDEAAYLKVAYVSSLDAMVQQGIAAKTMGFVGQISQIAQAVQLMPTLTDTLNIDEIIKNLGDANMLPATFFRKPEEIEQRRSAMAQQQQIINQSQADLNNSQAIANLAKAQRDGGEGFLEEVAAGMNNK